MSDFPAVAPTLNLDFANSKQLDPRVTFRRASTGTYVDSDGLIKTANIDQPRFDHDPVTGVCKGLLVEESRQNLVTYSEQFDNAAWSKTNGTIAPNEAIAPDGTTTADRFILSNDSGVIRHSVKQTVGSYTTAVTFSVFLKTSTPLSVVTVKIGGVGLAFEMSFNLVTGTPSGVPYTANVINASYSISTFSNGWNRISVTGTAASTFSITNVDVFNDSQGNGSDNFFIWGAQLEAGSSPTSYIPTTASTVTRSADLASITGTNFSSWYNQSEGTFYINKPSDFLRIANNISLLGATEGAIASTVSIGNGIKYGSGNPASNSRFFVTANSATQADIFTSLSNPRKIVLSYKTNDFGFGADSFFGKDLSGEVPINVDRFTLRAAGSNTFSRIAYWPKRLPDAQLQALTRR